MAVSKVILNGDTLIDATTATALATDITAPKTAMLADGVMTTGTGSGGGGGLEYEEGTWTPASDVAQPTISFVNTHTTRPFYVLISDVNDTPQATASSTMAWAMVSFYDTFGCGIYSGANDTTAYHYARTLNSYRSGDSTTYGGYSITGLTGDTTAFMSYFLTNTNFKPYTGSRYFRPGRTYKWIAVWLPTT